MPSDLRGSRRSVAQAIAARTLAPGRTSGTRTPRALGDQLAFARGFVAHPAQVGSVIPSSRFLEGRLVRVANLEQARTVVELGPGTGGTTRALLRALRPDARLLAIELSAAFHSRLVDKIDDPRLAIQLGSAERLAEFLRMWQLPAPDVVVSGIPFSTMPVQIARQTASAIADNLAAGGRFVAYQVRACVAEFMTPLLGAPIGGWEWRNVPPLRVFRWTKPGL